MLKKLSQNVNSESVQRQEWAQEWFQLQNEWLEKVKDDQNYFDDKL